MPLQIPSGVLTQVLEASQQNKLQLERVQTSAPVPAELFACFPSPAGRNEPLKKDRPKWKSDYPMTEGQLRSKRDEFWDTAPAFEGRKEIWDALKAAAVALECNDHDLAQAIVDGASITLPHGADVTVDK